MADSITSRIVARVTTRLANAAEGAGIGLTAANVARSRRRPTERDELPMVTVRPLTERVQKARRNINCTAVLRELNIAVTVRCEGEDVDLDAFRNFAIETVMTDQTCGGLAAEVEEVEHDWDGEGAATDADYAQDTIQFVVRYQTARNSAVSK